MFGKWFSQQNLEFCNCLLLSLLWLAFCIGRSGVSTPAEDVKTQPAGETERNAPIGSVSQPLVGVNSGNNLVANTAPAAVADTGGAGDVVTSTALFG